MFGLSFGELMVLLLVAVVVLGPKELPRYLRKAGQFAGRLRRLAYDMREKSGIDEVLRSEGIDRDIAEIRKLARGEIGGVVAAVRSTANGVRLDQSFAGSYADPVAPTVVAPAITLEREYPPEGADAYGALPDHAPVEAPLPASPLADDALYARGESEAPTALATTSSSSP